MEFVWEIGGGSEPFSMPQDVGIDPQGNLWVLDMAHHQFQIFSPDGEFLESWGSMGEGEGEFSFFEGPIDVYTEFGGEVAFDRDGNAYVADMANQRIQKFAPDHTFLTAWGEEGYQEGQFSRPFNLAIDAADNIYVADFRRNNVQQFTTCGAFVRTVVERGDSLDELHEPGGLTIDRDGNIWVGRLGDPEASHIRCRRDEARGDRRLRHRGRPVQFSQHLGRRHWAHLRGRRGQWPRPDPGRRWQLPGRLRQ